jgi:hypothetical protein
LLHSRCDETANSAAKDGSCTGNAAVDDDDDDDEDEDEWLFARDN